uniref:Uncharacterized protein n=1 Tax=Globisporangium ultimum (strain ATCC 200006 / CBS 805.95 / DAOM BR144) TaxID=431595 RepID=K3XB14_GLOUD
MRVKVRVAHEKTWISALPESLKHEFSMDELEQMKEQAREHRKQIQQHALCHHDSHKHSCACIGDGSIAASELVVLMKSMGIGIALDEVQKLIDKVDDNHSGELEFAEFVRLISELRRGNGDKLATFIQYSKLALEIRKELTDLTKNPTPLSQVLAVKENAWEWSIRIRGPPSSPYDGGVFNFHVRRFGHEYPYEPPVLTCLTRIYHPNFVPLLNGTMSLYGLKDQWEPEWRMHGLLECVEALLAVPDADLINAFYEETLQLESLAARAQAANGSPTKKGRQSRDITMECIDAYLLAPDQFAQKAQEFTAKCATTHTMESACQC